MTKPRENAHYVKQSDPADPVHMAAAIIVQEGKAAALEIAEDAGVEFALDAVNHIAEVRQSEAVFYREEADRLRAIIADLIEGENPQEGSPQWYAVRNAKAALNDA